LDEDYLEKVLAGKRFMVQSPCAGPRLLLLTYSGSNALANRGLVNKWIQTGSYAR
jgi:hypothetical protein